MHGADDEAAAARRAGDLTAEGARRLDAIYSAELLGRMGGYAHARRVPWHEFEKYADAKEAGECSAAASPRAAHAHAGAWR